MAFQTVFKRYELKYMLTLEQKEKIQSAMSTYMQLDKYGQITIRNDDLQVKNLMLLIACIDNSLKENDSVEIEGGNYLVVGIGGTTATVKMPVSLSAMVIVLGDNSPSIKTGS